MIEAYTEAGAWVDSRGGRTRAMRSEQTAGRTRSAFHTHAHRQSDVLVDLVLEVSKADLLAGSDRAGGAERGGTNEHRHDGDCGGWRVVSDE